MLTLVEAISLAGDRTKQNDDLFGVASDRAWMIDGATDLHDTPVTLFPSDAAWIAHHLNDWLHRWAPQTQREEFWLRVLLRHAADAAATEFLEHQDGAIAPAWKSPTASALLIARTEEGVTGLDLGDCRCFALDAAGAAHAQGGSPAAAASESQSAADAAKHTSGALLDDPAALETLRAKRARHNTPDGYWIFGLQPECADHARAWKLDLARPAHLLLCTDGFSALADRYGAYDAAGLVRAALEKGLHELAHELRAIETADAGGALHPRWKRSDDATALLLRLT